MRLRMLVFVMAVVPALAWAEDPISVKLSFNPNGSGSGRKELKVSLQPGADIKLPELKAAQPLYVPIELADGRHMMVIDRADKTGKYCRVIADTNGDGDLTNDPPHSAEPMEFSGVYFMNFRKVPFEIKQGGRTTKASFAVSLTVISKDNADPTSETLDNMNVSLSASGSYGGSMKLGGRDYKLAVYDSNLDGLPGSFVNQLAFKKHMEQEIIAPEADQIHVEDISRKEGYDLPFCRRFVLEGKMYGLAFDPEKNTVTFIPEGEKGLVPLEIGNGIDHMALVNENGSDSIAMIEPREKEMVPAGRWRPIEYGAERKDDKGFNWLVFANSTKSTPLVEVGKNGGKLALAESFTPRAVFDPELISGEKQPRGRVAFNYIVVGNNNEIVRTNMYKPAKVGLFDALSGDKGWKQPPAPKFTITTADGEKVSEGQFEYG